MVEHPSSKCKALTSSPSITKKKKEKKKKQLAPWGTEPILREY
jgi:hypothetical protein